MHLKHLTICLFVFLIIGCQQEPKDAQQKLKGYVVVNDSDDAEEWLKNIFKTKKSDQYFPGYI